jgi:hypothetical protein
MWVLVVHRGILKPTPMNSNSQFSNKKLILLPQVIKTSISLCILESSYISVEIFQRIHQCTLKFEKQERKPWTKFVFDINNTTLGADLTSRVLESRCSIVVSIPACHAGDPGSIPGSGAEKFLYTFFIPVCLPCMGPLQCKECCCKRTFVCSGGLYQYIWAAVLWKRPAFFSSFFVSLLWVLQLEAKQATNVCCKRTVNVD